MENVIMSVLLHNLLARAPQSKDLKDVTGLLALHDLVEDGVSDYTEAKLNADWHRPGFDLAKDAWVIFTAKGQLVGYADIWMCQHVQIEMRIRVHPEYRQRGIGTLLLRLAEDRARNYARKADTSLRITLHSAISSADAGARRLLEHEGFTLENHYWRLSMISERYHHPSEYAFDVYANRPVLLGIAAPRQRTGLYGARRYDVYEKELRAGEYFQHEDDNLSVMV
jgi:GNAT superfamily N-acetyltransferase